MRTLLLFIFGFISFWVYDKSGWSGILKLSIVIIAPFIIVFIAKVIYYWKDIFGK